MRVFIIDTSNMGPELQGGLIGVVGSTHPTKEEKQGMRGHSQPVRDGWVGDQRGPIHADRWLAALTAEAACVPFVSAPRLAMTVTAALMQR